MGGTAEPERASGVWGGEGYGARVRTTLTRAELFHRVDGAPRWPGGTGIRQAGEHGVRGTRHIGGTDALRQPPLCRMVPTLGLRRCRRRPGAARRMPAAQTLCPWNCGLVVLTAKEAQNLFAALRHADAGIGAKV